MLKNALILFWNEICETYTAENSIHLNLKNVFSSIEFRQLIHKLSWLTTYGMKCLRTKNIFNIWDNSKKKNDMAKKNPSRLYSIIHIRNENMNFDTNAWKIDGRFILRFVRRQLISKLTRENVLLSKIWEHKI